MQDIYIDMIKVQVQRIADNRKNNCENSFSLWFLKSLIEKSKISIDKIKAACSCLPHASEIIDSAMQVSNNMR